MEVTLLLLVAPDVPLLSDRSPGALWGGSGGGSVAFPGPHHQPLPPLSTARDHRLPAWTLNLFWDTVLLLWSLLHGEARPGGHGMGQARETNKAKDQERLSCLNSPQVWGMETGNNGVYRLLQMGPL